MKYRFFYGMKPGIRNLRPGDFSRKGYVCDLLLQTGRGTPVAVSYNRELDIWISGACSTAFLPYSSEPEQTHWPTAKAGSTMQTDRRCDP